MNRRLLAVTVLALLATATVSQVAVANFNAATGFSGRHGFTCTSCHNVPDMGPLGDEPIYDPPAKVTLTGLPEEWMLGQSYEFTITVTGGPPAAPSPAPQGGFEIEANGGVFRVPEGMADFIHVYAEDEQAVTYTVEGTQMREWRVTWIAPALPSDGIDAPAWWAGLDQLDATPTDVTFWVAAMSANGNHIVAAEASDQGELGDSVDNLTASIPPAQEVIDAWEAYLLAPPRFLQEEDESGLEVRPFEAFSLSGKHRDRDATHLAYRLDDGAWERIPTAGLDWRLDFGNGLTPGDHTLGVRSESNDRMSAPVEVAILVADVEEVETPMPAVGLLIGALLLAVIGRRMQ